MGKGGLNRILFSCTEVQERTDGIREVVLEENDARATHIRNILGARTGTTLRAAVNDEGICDATVVDCECELSGSDACICIRTGNLRLMLGSSTMPRSLPPLTLCVALPRPRATARMVRAVAQLGVRSLILTGGARVERSFFAAKLTQPSALLAAARLGVMQAAVDASTPDIVIEPRLWELERHLPAHGSTARIVLHPGASESLESVLRVGEAQAVTLAVGPEGGWLDNEIAFLQRIGFVSAGLGNRILASEIAVAVGLGIVHAYLGRDTVDSPDAPALIGGSCQAVAPR